MRTASTKERVSINIDKDLLKWIQEQVKRGEFDTQSAGVRKCILVAMRVYEKASPEEVMKFVHGKEISSGNDGGGGDDTE